MGIEQFSKHLQTARQDKNLTQKQLADKLGVTAQAVSKWERGIGFPDIAALGSIANILECSADYLLDHTNIQKDLGKSDSLEHRADIARVLQGYPVSFRFGTDCVGLLQKVQAENWQPLHELRVKMAAFGVLIPIVGIRDTDEIPKDAYRFLLYRQPVAGQEGIFSEQMLAPDCTADMITPVFEHFGRFVVTYYDRILNRQLVTELIQIVEEKYPAAIRGIVPDKISLSLLQRVFGILVAKHNKSIENPLKIIELIEDHPDITDPDKIVTLIIEYLQPRDIVL